MTDSRTQKMGELYSQLLRFENTQHPFDQRLRRAIMMHPRFGRPGMDHHDMHNFDHWSEHIEHHFRGPIRDVLEIIQKQPQINAHTISEQTDILPGTLSKYLKKMIGRHLVIEETNPDNRREKFYSLTEAGEWLLGVAHGVQEDDQDAKNEIFDEFTADEQDVIVRFLTAMRDRDRQ